jgi:DNA mismatch repair protein MutS
MEHISLNTDKIFGYYVSTHNEYIERYGEKTVIIMMVGYFYEIYGLPHKEQWIGANLRVLEDILNIHIGKKNGAKELSVDNPHMMGFPCEHLLRHQNNLLKGGYTLVFVDQVTEPPNPERKVSRILSPSTTIDGYDLRETNYLLSLYVLEYPHPSKTSLFSVGVSAIDLSTGKNMVHLVQSKAGDPPLLWLDDVYRLVHKYRPTEILLHYDEITIDIFNDWCHRLQIDPQIIHLNFCKDRTFLKPSYQNAFYRKVYPDTGMLEPIEYLGLTNTEMRMSHIYMVQFIYEHRIENVREIMAPKFTPPKTSLILTSNAMYQLYIIDVREHQGETYSSLMSLLNRCQTAVGRRLCRERMLSPIIDKQTLEKRYSMIDIFRKDDLYKQCQKPLSNINDIERAFRKMGLGILQPDEFARLDTSFHYLLEASSIVRDSYNSDTVQTLETWRKNYQEVFCMKQLSLYDPNKCQAIFQSGVSSELDAYLNEYKRAHIQIQVISDRLGKIIDPKKTDVVKIKHDKNGMYLITTNKRATTLKNRLSNMTEIVFKENNREFCRILSSKIYTRSKSKNDTEIVSEFIINLFNKIDGLANRIRSHNTELYHTTIQNYYQTHRNLFTSLVDYLGEIDLNTCMAKLSVENVYCRPELLPSEISQLHATQIRHPLVEKIQTEIPYVPNDVSLNQSGMLLYGTNACGKSTLMKSIGLAVVMAQAGFFVACQRFRFAPYTQLFTRILNNDNIFRSQSSFQVEILELRSIILKSDQNSLVLGDELCSGTETVSAVSIVSAGLKTMSQKKCSYIFTSHLHQLMQRPCVKQIENLDVHHMKVLYDPQKDILVYDRKLEDGPGPSTYGLDVCRSMNMGHDFISTARKVYIELVGESRTLVNLQKSNYNADVHMDQCGVCEQPATETHHINEQHTADKHGVIHHYHKNIKHNIVPLCHKCHMDVHHGTLHIDGYQQTSTGVQLHYKYADPPPQNMSSRKKLTTEDLLKIDPLITTIRNKQRGLTDGVRKLETDYDIHISITTLKKIVDKTY